MVRGPLRQEGVWGPWTLTRVTVPSPSSVLRRRTRSGASSFSWVAQAVEDVRTVRMLFSYDSGVQCWAVSGPTIDGQRAITPWTATSTSQPWSRIRRPSVLVSFCGSRSSGRALLIWAPSIRGRRRRLTGMMPPLAACCLSRPASDFANSRPCLSCWTSGPSSLSGPLSEESGGSGTPNDPFTDLEARPAELSGHVSADGSGHEHLLGRRDQLGEPVPALGVELGEHIVEDQHRFTPVRTEQFVRRQPQRERERPRLTVARVPLRRQVPEPEYDVIAMRTDQRDTALELVPPLLLNRLQQYIGQLLARRHARLEQDRGLVLQPRITLAPGNSVVRAGH